jgi:DNA-binding FadR family transcriptional regulator
MAGTDDDPDFRSVIEQTIARTAAQRRNDADIAAIRQAVAD